ncbi:unnamed protein product [Durusdinium trenchii]
MFDDELCWNEQKVNEYDEQFIPNGGVGAQAKGPESVNSGEHTPGTQTGEGLDLAAFNASSSSYPSNVDTYATFEDDDIDTDSNTSSGECSSVDAEGKGKKGKHPVTAMLAEMDDAEVQMALPAFRGPLAGLIDDSDLQPIYHVSTASQVRSQLDHQRRPQMAEFHQTQRDIDRLRRHRKDRIRNVNTAEAEYDGAADTCPLCCEKMEANESVLRLVCKHLYHVECWTSYLCHGEQLTCPVCRGSCHVIARFRVPADTDGPQRPQEASRPVTPDQTGRRDRELPDTFNIFTPPGRAPRINSESPEVGTPFLQQEQASNAYPWWPTESAALTTAYHSISIPDRAGVIIDPGAYTNLIGENTARMFAQKAIENGFKPRQWKMKPMYVQGVGEGQQKCEWTVSIPIACNLSVGGTKVCLNYFEASVVGGSGARLPALLGLKSLTSLSATLCMHANQEALYVPLPGGSIEDLQQCRKCPLSKAPSGHLIMTIDHWKELQEGTKAGVQPKPMVLHVDPYQPSQPSAPSSSM